MNYTCINIQGNLISEEILQKIETAEAQGQLATDFGFEPGSNLRNEIEYAWSRIKLDWKHFSDKSQNLSANDPYGTSLSRKWMEQFLSSLGFNYTREKTSLTGDNQKTYSISHTADGLDDMPLHIVGFTEPAYPEKNTLDIKTSGGTSRLSPHATVQEYLNVTEHLYGIATNGLYLRLIRDSGRLIKLTYVEFDIKRMMDEDKYSEFTLLYRLLHASRFPRNKTEADQCLLEKYYQDSIETGNRIRDGLSLAVKESLVALGKGFLQHEHNTILREKLQAGTLSSKDYYRQLLRIIYRFLFLMVTEERDLVYDPEDKSETTQRLKKIYLQFYSIARLRKLSESHYVYEAQFNDLWQGLVNTFLLFEGGSNGKKLGIQPLNGDLFSFSAIADLQGSFINNRLLLECIKNLNEFKDENKNLVAINYRSLDVEELGSVYEGLLELHPVIENIEASNPANINFTFHEGTDRKTTGSYYTRPELVNELIKSALIPVIEERLNEHTGNTTAQAKALLKLKVCDAAAGSGHMLLAAARTIAWYLARVQSGEENPAPSVYRRCLREVIQHCIYAVDYNPDAVELCKLALWLEGHNSGKPLSFLDHKIRNGNSLVGVSDLNVLQKGIPDDAFNPVTGDDKKICQELKKENTKYNKTKQATLDFDQTGKIDTSAFTGDYKELEIIQQDDVEGVKQVKTKFEKFRNNHTWFNDWRACNLWTAAFFWNNTEENKQAAPNSERLAKFLNNPAAAYGPMIGKSDALSTEHRFFHWPLEFPDVFEQGGFDVMLGNPPWEILELKEQEFFSTRDQNIAKAESKAKREKLINLLQRDNIELYNDFIKESHYYDATRKFIKSSNRFPLTAVGRINTYAVFTELFSKAISEKGRSGIVTPVGLTTDESNKDFIGFLLEKKKLIQIIGFENEAFIFPTVHHAFRFCLVTMGKREKDIGKVDFMFFCRYFEDVNDNARKFSLSVADIYALNPNTGNCSIFRTRKDADITLKIYKSNVIMINDNSQSNPWNISFKQGTFNMSSDSHLFKTDNDLHDNGFKRMGLTYRKENETYLSLYESKMIWHYDHRFGSYEARQERGFSNLATVTLDNYLNPNWVVNSYYYASSVENEKSLIGSDPAKTPSDIPKWFLGFRSLTGNTNERTAVFNIIPYAAAGNSFIILNDWSLGAAKAAVFLGMVNSLVFDFVVRQKIGGNNFNFFIVKQLPVIPPQNISITTCVKISSLVLELLYTSWDIKGFADDIWREADANLKATITKQWEENKVVTGGHEWSPPEWCEINESGCSLPPFKWDENRRAVLKAELDAIYAKLYGLTTEELRYILDPQDVYGPDFPGETFRVLKEKEIRLYGEYRTRRLVLEAWEKLNNQN